MTYDQHFNSGVNESFRGTLQNIMEALSLNILKQEKKKKCNVQISC